jgi:hypothetical protein
MTAMPRYRASLAVALVSLVLAAVPAHGQSVVPGTASRTASRAELESAAVSFDQLAASTAYGERTRARAREQAAVIRGRLTDGDFRAGDRIMVVIEGQLAVNDTITVLEGARLPVPGFRAISLSGVLRSELESKLRTELTDVVRNATVTARPLIRLAVFGAVAQPGYLSVPSETTVDDLLMMAGGPTATAEIGKLRLSRADTLLVGSSEIRAAVASGRTVASLDLADGDALVVPESGPPWDRNAVMQMSGFILGLVTIFLFQVRR